jgi:intracellular multiplication protein IcmC
MPDLMTILANLSSQITPIIELLQHVAALMGLYLVGTALIEIWGATNDNALKYLPGNTRYSVGSALAQLGIGAALSALSTLQLVGILSRTVTEDYANSRFLSYAPTGNSFDEQRLAALASLLGIMQIVGFTALVKALLTLNQRAKGQAQASIGMAVAWTAGGLGCWNFKWLTDVLNRTAGYNVIGIFTPFGVAN